MLNCALSPCRFNGTMHVCGQVTATLSLAAASAAAGITVLYDRDLGYCKMMDCRKFQISISFAFISWLLIEISSLIMFWLLAMG